MKNMNRWISVILALCVLMFGSVSLADEDNSETGEESAVETVVRESDPAPAASEKKEKAASESTEKQTASQSAVKESAPEKKESSEQTGSSEKNETSEQTSGSNSDSGTTSSKSDEAGEKNDSSSGSPSTDESGNQESGNQNGAGQNDENQNNGNDGNGTDGSSTVTEPSEKNGEGSGNDHGEGNGEENGGDAGNENGDGKGSTSGTNDENSESGKSNEESESSADEDGTEGQDGDPTDETDDPNGSNDGDDNGDDDPDDELEEFEIDENGVLTKYNGSAKLVEIPAGVTAIGGSIVDGVFKGAFEDNKNIEAVVLPESVKTIREKAFYNCPALCNVVVTSDYLFSIESKAFRECPSLPEDIQEQLKSVAEDVAKDAFDEKKKDDDDSSGSSGGQHSGTPSGSQGASGIEYATRTTTGSSSSRSSGTSTVRRHSRSLVTTTHDYDQVYLTGDNSGAMQTLTLGGEELELTLEGGGVFTAELFDPENPDGTEEEHLIYGDTLILASESDGEWKLNGTVLRKLNKSGVETLVLQNGGQSSSVPTEGFLAGWLYDELKSQGTAGRRFEYSLLAGADGLQWRVTVEGETYDLEEDPLAPIYLTGVVSWNEEEAQLAEMTDFQMAISGRR